MPSAIFMLAPISRVFVCFSNEVCSSFSSEAFALYCKIYDSFVNDQKISVCMLCTYHNYIHSSLLCYHRSVGHALLSRLVHSRSGILPSFSLLINLIFPLIVHSFFINLLFICLTNLLLFLLAPLIVVILYRAERSPA